MASDALNVFPELDVFENQYAHRRYTIEIRCPEFTSMCPKTGLPDFGTLIIRYTPNKLCLELKALKYYLLAYRNIGIFYEHGVNQILDHLTTASQPHWMELVGEFTPRGGIQSVISVTYGKREDENAI